MPSDGRASRLGAPTPTPNPDPYMWPALVSAVLFTLTAPLIIGTIVLFRPSPGAGAGAAGQMSSIAHTTSPGGASLSLVGLGQSTYASSCAVCHGPGAEGVKGLGKPLKNSAYVQSVSDDELFRLLVEGRPIGDPLNTSGVLMPPRGAQGIPDNKLHAVVSYLRSLQEEGAPFASTEAWEPAQGEEGSALVGAIELTEHPGYDLFISSCAACHGQGAEGLEGLGLPLTTSGFVRGMSDKDLITFIKTGRSSWDESNTTGLDMPPKGGNPAISEDQLQTIVDYIRAVQSEVTGS